VNIRSQINLKVVLSYKKWLLLFLLIMLPGCKDKEQLNTEVKETLEEVINEPLEEPLPQKEEEEIVKEPEATKKEEKKKELPKTVNNKAPFIVQAPFGLWDDLHQEACEEASILIAHYFIEGEEKVSKIWSEKDILKLSKFTRGEYPKDDDLNLKEILEVVKRYFGYTNWEIIKKPTIQKIKEELSEGNVIIVPLAGREINNPFFKQPGPLYHMLVISGYDENKKQFITQDPGTKRGKDFRYPYKTIMDATHDFPGSKEKIKSGEASVIVVPPK